MSTPLEHDYIGLSEVSTMDNSDSSAVSTEGVVRNTPNNVLNLKATELRLGLPGSESPERKTTPGLSLSLKRAFSDAIDGGKGCGKWGFSDVGNVDLCKGNGLFSPRGLGNGGLDNGVQQLVCSSSGLVTVVKEVVKASPKPVVKASANDQAPPAKAQVVGWPPIRSFRKNTMATPVKSADDAEGKLGAGCLYVKVSMDGAPYLRKVDLKTYSNYMELSAALEKMFGQCASHKVQGREGLSESRLMDLIHGSEYVLTYEDKDEDWMLVGDVPWEMFIDCCKRLRIMKGSDAIGLAPRSMKYKNRP